MRAGMFPRWPPVRRFAAGYTIVLPMPADLPVFLDLALAGFAAQDSEDHMETLVVPDRSTPASVDQIR